MTTRSSDSARAGRRAVLAGAIAGVAGLAAAAGVLPGQSAPQAEAATGGGPTDWLNVVDQYGADPSGATDSTAAIQAAIAACPPGGVVYLPAGRYVVAQPLVISGAGIRLQGSHAGNSGYGAGGSNAAIIDAAATFSGTAIIDTNLQPDFSMRDLNVHGSQLATGTVMGIFLNGGTNSGAPVGALLENIVVGRMPGTGIQVRAKGTIMRHVGVFHAGASTGAGSGFDISAPDSWYTNCLSAGHATSGWAISGANNTTFTACRAEDGAAATDGAGFVLTMTGMFGGISFDQCTTDLNSGDGFVVSGVTGNGVIQLNGCEFRRDGNNGGAGGGGFSGIKVTSTAVPVLIAGTTVTARQGDSGGTDAPLYGLTMTGSSGYVSVNGAYLSCASGGRAVNWDGNGTLVISPGGLLTATVSGSAPSLNLPAPSGPNLAPQDHNLIGWTYDPVLQTGSTAPSAGVLYLIRIPVYTACSISNILVEVVSAGTGLTTGQNWAGLYNASGALLAQTTDQSAAWTTTGLKEMALTSPRYASQGWYYVVIVTNGTTPPSFGRATVQGASAINAGLTPGTARYATNSTGQHTLPASITLSGNTVNWVAYWAALS